MVKNCNKIYSFDSEGGQKHTKRPRERRLVQADDFHSLELNHPYGVFPLGNSYFEQSNSRSLRPGLTGWLTDEVWNEIMLFCGGNTIARLVQTCHFFYVAGHQPELWRDLVLRKMISGVITAVGPTWKDTYVKLFHADTYKHHHSPISSKRVFSDCLFRLHSCRAFHIPPAWFDANSGDIARKQWRQLNRATFLDQYERMNAPLVVEGAALEWPAFQKWQDLSYLEQHTKGQAFRATSGVAALPASFSMESYLQYCQSTNLEEAPLYLFDRSALEPGSTLWADYAQDLRKTCPYWDPDSFEHDLFKVLGEGRRPDHTWLIVGPKRSGSVFHIDPNATHAWNATIRGRKRWIFYPPGVRPPGVYPSDDGDQVALPLSIGEWLFQFWEEHVQRTVDAPMSERPLECTALPGDVIFVPHGWWHMVINLDDINIAITHNYVGLSNLSNVVRFLNTKREQVSGCRDRGDSIKPDRLYEEFVNALQSYCPDELHLSQKASDWTCAAWKERPKVSSSSSKQRKPEKESASANVMTAAKPDVVFRFSFI